MAQSITNREGNGMIIYRWSL